MRRGRLMTADFVCRCRSKGLAGAGVKAFRDESDACGKGGRKFGMHLKKRLISAAAVAAMAAAVLYGTTFEMSEADQEARHLPWTPRKDTIYFWYTDDAMTNYINSAAVVFGEREDVHVIPILKEDSEYLEAVNEASLHSEQMPDAYMINHDSLEKAYLAGLAVAVDDVEQVCDEAHFPASALSAVSYKGRTAAYPFFFETSVLVYNENYLAE